MANSEVMKNIISKYIHFLYSLKTHDARNRKLKCKIFIWHFALHSIVICIGCTDQRVLVKEAHPILISSVRLHCQGLPIHGYPYFDFDIKNNSICNLKIVGPDANLNRHYLAIKSIKGFYYKNSGEVDSIYLYHNHFFPRSSSRFVVVSPYETISLSAIEPYAEYLDLKRCFIVELEIMLFIDMPKQQLFPCLGTQSRIDEWYLDRILVTYPLQCTYYQLGY
jgi:hypothetical protein